KHRHGELIRLRRLDEWAAKPQKNMPLNEVMDGVPRQPCSVIRRCRGPRPKPKHEAPILQKIEYALHLFDCFFDICCRGKNVSKRFLHKGASCENIRLDRLPNHRQMPKHPPLKVEEM